MNDANLILAQLKAEMAVLKKDLDNCLLDYPDYESAQYFQKAMELKSYEIQAIERRANQNYDAMRMCESHIKLSQHGKKRLEDQLNDNTKKGQSQKFTFQHLEEINNKLDRYQAEYAELQKSKVAFHVDSDIVLEAIENLLDSWNQGITLEILFHKELYYILVEKMDSELKIRFLKSTVYERSRGLNLGAKRCLQSMNFVLHAYQWELTLDNRNINRDHIMEIVTSIVFDVIRPNNKATCQLIIC